MNNQFDELAKALAQPVARRAALKRFSVGLVGAALAALGLGKAEAAKPVRYWCCIYKSGYKSCYPEVNGTCTQNPYDLRGRLVTAKRVSDCGDC